MAARQSTYYEKRRTLILRTYCTIQYVSVPGWYPGCKIWYTQFNTIGADSGFDGICETQGACRGAVCLVKSRKKIVANDENYALAA